MSAPVFRFRLLSPSRAILESADARLVIVPGLEGDFGVMKGHVPCLSLLRAGLIVVYTADQDQRSNQAARRFFTPGGSAETDGEALTIYVEDSVDIDAMPENYLARAYAALEDHSWDERARRVWVRSALDGLQKTLDVPPYK